MFEATDPVVKKAALREGAYKQDRILIPALVASAIYAVAIASMSGNLDSVGSLVATTCMLVAPFEVLILLKRRGIRPPAVYLGGILGFILICVAILCAAMAPVLVLMAAMALAAAIQSAVPAIPEWGVLLLFELLPLLQAMFIVVQLARAALIPRANS